MKSYHDFFRGSGIIFLHRQTPCSPASWISREQTRTSDVITTYDGIHASALFNKYFHIICEFFVYSKAFPGIISESHTNFEDLLPPSDFHRNSWTLLFKFHASYNFQPPPRSFEALLESKTLLKNQGLLWNLRGVPCSSDDRGTASVRHSRYMCYVVLNDKQTKEQQPRYDDGVDLFWFALEAHDQDVAKKMK